VHDALDEGFLCHVGFVVDGDPVVLPHLYARVGETVYLHGSTGARALRPGVDPRVCVTVTHVDGLVLARSAFHHSMNYRSVVMHGQARTVRDEVEKREALDALVDAVAEGRSSQARPANAKEFAATSVLALLLDEVSVKTRTGPPVDEAQDLSLDVWAGLLPLSVVAGRPITAEGVTAPVPANIAGWKRPR
jgi:nitroimidazol reductase NimA-like FMN-containing flavoprotein (pyridoxamine 5'-phosphate oxidase superfamily)